MIMLVHNNRLSHKIIGSQSYIINHEIISEAVHSFLVQLGTVYPAPFVRNLLLDESEDAIWLVS